MRRLGLLLLALKMDEEEHVLEECGWALEVFLEKTRKYLLPQSLQVE